MKKPKRTEKMLTLQEQKKLQQARTLGRDELAWVHGGSGAEQMQDKCCSGCCRWRCSVAL